MYVLSSTCGRCVFTPVLTVSARACVCVCVCVWLQVDPVSDWRLFCSAHAHGSLVERLGHAAQLEVCCMYMYIYTCIGLLVNLIGCCPVHDMGMDNKRKLQVFQKCLEFHGF